MGRIEYELISMNGLITTETAEKAGIARSRLSEAVAAGQLERVARGIYCIAGSWDDEYAIACLRFPKGTLSHGTALFLHGICSKAPEHLTMTFSRAYNATTARRENIEVRTCAASLLELGLTSVKTPSGNLVRCYDAERTLCDIVRGKSTIDTQVVNPAMRAYLSSSEKDPNKLMAYAKKLGVEQKIQRYVEVLL